MPPDLRRPPDETYSYAHWDDLNGDPTTEYIRKLPYAHVSPHVFDYFAGRLVGTDAKQPWMAEFAVDRPFDERHLHDNHWPHPVRSHTR